jgi:hypothetical protein
MAMKASAAVRQWLSSDDMENPEDTKARAAEGLRCGVFCAVCGETLCARYISDESVELMCELLGELLVSARCELLFLE